MIQPARDVNAPSLDNDIEARLRATLAEISRAVFDGRVSRTHVQMLVIIGELPLSYYSWDTLGNLIVERRAIASAESAAGIQREPLSEHHVETILSSLKTLGYIRKEKRPIPEAGNKRLTTYQLARLAEQVHAARSARVFKFSAPARRNSTNPPRTPGNSAPARTRKSSLTEKTSGARSFERPRPAETPARTKAVRLRDMAFVTTEAEADAVYAKLYAEIDQAVQLSIFSVERERLRAAGKLFAREFHHG